MTPSSAARATSRRRRLRGALPCETRQVVVPTASRIQRELAAAGASPTGRARAHAGAPAGGGGAAALRANPPPAGRNAATPAPAPRRAPVRHSVHSFHSSILRSMNALNNGTLGPTVDHAPERLLSGDRASLQGACPMQALGVRSAQRSRLRSLERRATELLTGPIPPSDYATSTKSWVAA